MIFYPASLSILRNLTFAPHCAVGNDATGGSDALRAHRERVAQLQAEKRKRKQLVKEMMKELLVLFGRYFCIAPKLTETCV